MSGYKPIGVFDSGVGGLSVLSHLRIKLPFENLVFLADQKHVPYGQKTQKELHDLTERVTKFLLNFDIKLLVVACNTASCYAIGHLRSKFSIPIVGVVPAIKPAISLTKTGRIAVMSTPATAKSRYLKDLIGKFANGKKILRLGCSGLEDSIETLDSKKTEKLLNIYVSKVKSFGADVIVLGCTHYPFLKGEIAKRLGNGVRIVDSGKAVAERVNNLLQTPSKISQKNLKQFKQVFFTTGDPLMFSQVASKLLKYNIVGKKAYI